VITEPATNQIEKIVECVPGWTPADQLYTLYLLLLANNRIEGDVIEIGSWCGRSTSVIGMAARQTSVKKMVCIDLFPKKGDWYQNKDGSWSFKVIIDGKEHSAYNRKQTVWDEVFQRDILPVYKENDSVLQTFLERTIWLSDIIHIIKGDSDSLRDNLSKTFRCKFAFIDGDHNYEAVCKDIENVGRFLVPGAWICFDDAFTSYYGVSQAVTDLIINNPEYELQQQMTRKLFVARRL
jgi:predicted O-methyltransferase YrrM